MGYYGVSYAGDRGQYLVKADDAEMANLLAGTSAGKFISTTGLTGDFRGETIMLNSIGVNHIMPIGDEEAERLVEKENLDYKNIKMRNAKMTSMIDELTRLKEENEE